MSFDKLDPEIWVSILEFLGPSLPVPLSGFTKGEAVGELDETLEAIPEDGAPGITVRGDLASKDLAMLSRTSIPFHSLASKLLYRRIFSDDFPRLICSISTVPAHPQILSTSELLASTQSLHIEYKQKGDAPTYRQIMNDPRDWDSVGAATPLHAAISQAMVETADLESALKRLVQGATPFPKLSTLTVGAIFSGQDGLWEKVAALRDPDMAHYGHGYGCYKTIWLPEASRDSVANCSAALVELFRRSPLTHHCSRGHAGPLALPSAFDWSASQAPSTPLFTYHYNTNVEEPTGPMPVGAPIRWMMEQHNPNQKFTVLISFIGQMLRVAFAARQRMVYKQIGHPPPKTPASDVTIYSSLISWPTPPPLISPSDWAPGRPPPRLHGESQQQAIARWLGLLQDGIPQIGQNLRASDRLAWKTSSECSRCEACGWDIRNERGILSQGVTQSAVGSLQA